MIAGDRNEFTLHAPNTLRVTLCALARPGQNPRASRRPKSSSGNSGSVLARLAQHVAAPPNCLDVILAARSVGELFAQLADENVDDLGFGLVQATIELIEEDFLGQRGPLAQA